MIFVDSFFLPSCLPVTTLRAPNASAEFVVRELGSQEGRKAGKFFSATGAEVCCG